MHYYEFNLKKFRAGTWHLSIVEKAIYRELIDIYYDTEQQLTLDVEYLKRLLRIKSKAEVTAFDTVLAEFFIKTESGYYNQYCDELVQSYHEAKSAKSEAGKASAEARRLKREQRLAELNGEVTNNQQDRNTIEADSEQTFNSGSTDSEQTFNSGSTDSEQTFNSGSTEAQRNPTKLSNLETKETKLKTYTQNTCEEKIDLDEILSLWNPDLHSVNSWLVRSGEVPFSQQQFDEFKPAFLNYYAEKLKIGLLKPNDLFGKMVSWVKRDKSYSTNARASPNNKNPPKKSQASTRWDEIQELMRKEEQGDVVYGF